MDGFHRCPSPESLRVICESIQRKVKDFFSFYTCSISGRAESLQEIYPKNPIDAQPRRKGDHEDFKRLDNEPPDLQALETKARHCSVRTLDTGYGTSRRRMTQIVR